MMNTRKKQQLFRFAVDMFIDILQQVTKRKNVPYKCNDADKISWDSFVNTFGDNIGEEFVRNFIQYGIQSWFNPSAGRDYSKSIRFTWIFGKEAIKRWQALNAETRTWCVRSCLKKEHKIKTLTHKSQLSELLLKVRANEESYKKEFHNTNRGLMWCIANTSLYFHKSAICVNCINKKECKEILRTEYPIVYRLRGYGK